MRIFSPTLTLATCSLVLGLSSPLSAQDKPVVFNADFERCSDSKWVDGWLQIQHAGDRVYRYACDFDRPFQGKISARLEQTGPQEFGSFIQRISASDYVGKRVKLSGAIRAAKVGEDGGGLFLRIDGDSDIILTEDAVSGKTSGTHDWLQKSVVIDVPLNAKVIEIGVTIEALGTIWADHLELALTDSPVTKSKPALSGAKTLSFESTDAVRTKPKRIRDPAKQKE
jgi:hypothetical protein